MSEDRFAFDEPRDEGRIPPDGDRGREVFE